MDGDPKTISLTEAFRVLLRARHPGRLADEIKSYDWFRRPETRRKDCDPVEVDAATDALRLLDDGIRSGKLPLLGIRGPGIPLVGIDQGELTLGSELLNVDVFSNILKLYWSARSLTVSREYTNVRTNRADVLELIPPLVPVAAAKWMLDRAEANAVKGGVAKRADMIADCKNATGATKREAEAAFNSLPEHLRRKRGNLSKRPG
jgi:hypothetical protein